MSVFKKKIEEKQTSVPWRVFHIPFIYLVGIFFKLPGDKHRPWCGFFNLSSNISCFYRQVEKHDNCLRLNVAGGGSIHKNVAEKCFIDDNVYTFFSYYLLTLCVSRSLLNKCNYMIYNLNHYNYVCFPIKPIIVYLITNCDNYDFEISFTNFANQELFEIVSIYN